MNKLVDILLLDGRLKEATELAGIYVLAEKNNNKCTINIIIKNNCIEMSLNGYYWHKNNYKNYHKIKAVYITNKILNYKTIQKIMLNKLYEAVIKECLLL